jgi:hypothetical protein
MEKAEQLLDYIATYPDAQIRFRAPNMVMNVHLDALYLLKADVCSQACRHFLLDGPP